jgi:hypothetical protein
LIRFVGRQYPTVPSGFGGISETLSRGAMKHKSAKMSMLMNKDAWIAEGKKEFFSPLHAIG